MTNDPYKIRPILKKITNMDRYNEKYVVEIITSDGDANEISRIIDEIYDDGYNDGFNSNKLN